MDGNKNEVCKTFFLFSVGKTDKIIRKYVGKTDKMLLFCVGKTDIVCLKERLTII